MTSWLSSGRMDSITKVMPVFRCHVSQAAQHGRAALPRFLLVFVPIAPAGVHFHIVTAQFVCKANAIREVTERTLDMLRLFGRKLIRIGAVFLA